MIGGVLLAGEVNKDKLKKKNNELLQLLICVAVIGLFLLIEIWLIFYYAQGFVFPLIFGILIILMACLMTLNIYQIFINRTAMNGGNSDKKAEFLIYKQVKSLPEVFEKKLRDEIKNLSENVNKTQKITAKAVLVKVEEQLEQLSAQENNSNIKDEFDSMKSELNVLKSQIDELKVQNTDLSKRLESALSDNTSLKGSFSDLQSQQNKILELLDRLFSQNDEIKSICKSLSDDNNDIGSTENKILSQSTDVSDGMTSSANDDVTAEVPTSESTISEEPKVSPIQIDTENYDPNKQLSPEEIAAMFANI